MILSKEKMLHLCKQNKTQVMLFVSLFLIGAMLILDSAKSRENSGDFASQQEGPSPDTYIPFGYTLVPLELQNTESIGSMIQDFAIVDLYVHSLTEKHASKIGSRLRLLRAPLNPDKFAVLVPDSQAGVILGANGPISASILNRKHEGLGNINASKKSSKLNVQYYEGEK